MEPRRWTLGTIDAWARQAASLVLYLAGAVALMVILLATATRYALGEPLDLTANVPLITIALGTFASGAVARSVLNGGPKRGFGRGSPSEPDGGAPPPRPSGAPADPSDGGSP